MSTKTLDNGGLSDYTVEFEAGNTTADTQRIVIASDQAEIPTSLPTSSSATETTGTASGTAGDKVNANSSRKAGYVQNLDTSIDIHCSFGGTATTSHTKIHPGGSLSLEVGGVVFTGAVNLIAASGTPKFVIVELT